MPGNKGNGQTQYFAVFGIIIVIIIVVSAIIIVATANELFR